MSDPKLFIAAGTFHPESGGPATYLYTLLPELQARNWDIRVVTYGNDTIDYYPYPITRIPRNTYPLRAINYARAAAEPLNWADVTYVHSIGLPLMGGHSPRILKVVGDVAWERSIRKGWIAPTEDLDTFQTKSYSLTVNTQKLIRNRSVQSMDAVIVPSHYLKNLVHGWGVKAEKIHVIYNAVNNTPPTPSQADAKQQLGWDDTPSLMVVARMVHWKGVDHIMQALKFVPDVKLYVAGDGAMLEPWQTMAENEGLSDRVIFLGKVPRKDVPLYMQAVDYVILYSGYEGLSHVIIEALQVGTPVIASNKGGNPEVVNHMENGLLAPYVDIPALTETIKDAFRPGLRDQLAQNTSKNMERFQFSTMIDATESILRQFADR